MRLADNVVPVADEPKDLVNAIGAWPDCGATLGKCWANSLRPQWPFHSGRKRSLWKLLNRNRHSK